MRLIVYALYYFVRVLNYAILIYCIMSWFVNPGSKLFYAWKKLEYFLMPIFTPAKLLLSKIRFTRNLPIDFSPWLTVILLNMVYNLLIRLIYVF